IGNLQHVINNIALTQNGVDIDSVTWVPIPNDALQEAALNGQVDAIIPLSFFHSVATAAGFRQIGGGINEFFPNTPLIVWVASGELSTEKAEAIERFNAAMEEANRFANDNPDVVREIDHELTQLPA